MTIWLFGYTPQKRTVEFTVKLTGLQSGVVFMLVSEYTFGVTGTEERENGGGGPWASGYPKKKVMAVRMVA